MPEIPSIFVTLPERHGKTAHIFHRPTQTLAEIRFNSAPGGGHLLTIRSDGPPPDELVRSTAAAIETLIPHASDHLTVRTLPPDPDSLPIGPLVLASVFGEPAVLIAYPAVGFSAGVLVSGPKIPPLWTDQTLARLTPEQRSHLIQNAAEELMRAIATFHR